MTGIGGHRRWLRWAFALLAAVLLAIGIDWVRDRVPAEPALSAAEWGGAGYGPTSFAAAKSQLDAQVAGREGLLRGQPDDWLHEEALAHALMRRSRLATDYGDLARAEAILAKAVGDAHDPAGPLLSRAAVSMMGHKLGQSAAALDTIARWAVPPDDGEESEIAGLRGDIAFYRGDMAGAGQWYARSAALGGGPAAAYRQANLAKARGDFGEALARFRDAGSPRDTPFAHASTALQIGAVELARGDYHAAGEWFAAADRQFPGYWMFQAHRAQALAVRGDLPAGIAAMRRIAQAAPAAEVMDALAMLLRANGEAAESKQWAARAGAEWQRRLALAPEAAYGHALEHELLFGTPQRALELARANLAARPFGESRVLLASALIANGSYREALSQLGRAEASGWRSAPLFALKAQVYELTGHPQDAVRAREAATALNPRIFAPETSLVWFSHG
jgi:tetratricopeptide (TPR) repeat protein